MNGTWSWYWAVDNFGLYSIEETTPAVPDIDRISLEGGVVTINWKGATGVRLQKSTRLAKPNTVTNNKVEQNNLQLMKQ